MQKYKSCQLRFVRESYNNSNNMRNRGKGKKLKSKRNNMLKKARLIFQIFPKVNEKFTHIFTIPQRETKSHYSKDFLNCNNSRPR